MTDPLNKPLTAPSPSNTSSPASCAELDGKCSKTGIRYAEAIKEMQGYITDCDAHGIKAQYPMAVRVRVLMDAIIEAALQSAAMTGEKPIEGLDFGLEQIQNLLDTNTGSNLGKIYESDLKPVLEAARRYHAMTKGGRR